MELFEPRAIVCILKVFSIVTHNWSSNLYKGYENIINYGITV